MRAWKLDLWIALAALLVGALTASAAIYQSKVFADQLSATVWPYISFVTTISNNGTFEMRLENDGAGPAVIEGAQLMLDGTPVPKATSVLSTLGYRPSRGSSSTTGDVTSDEVIRPGDSKVVLSIHDPAFIRIVRILQHRAKIRLYYCSMLNHCWVATSAGGRPQDISEKAIPSSSIRW